MTVRSGALGPLPDGGRVVIIGAGPGGTGTALALRRLAQEMGRTIQITLFEGKVFAGERHFNQCVGVLSPPIDEMLPNALGVRFPYHLVQREICGYVLHSDTRAILLKSNDPPDRSVRRVHFDAYMLEQARAQGVELVASRVTDLEFHADEVIVYGESGIRKADVVVGAFGADEGTAAVFERTTDYRAPHFMSSIVTKIHPPEEDMSAFGNWIHAFLPSIRRIEFGAVTPKGNHLTINIAGGKIDALAMEAFLASPAVQAVLPRPTEPQQEGDLVFYRGRFPISQARAFTGDRYVIIGDAAGLVRPFKGKGVYSAFLTGLRAAQTIMTAGVSASAWQGYHDACRDITGDMPYGKAMRALAMGLSKTHALDVVIALAQQDPRLRRALFDAVSAHQNYRAIVGEMLDVGWLAATARRLAGMPLEKPRS